MRGGIRGYRSGGAEDLLASSDEPAIEVCGDAADLEILFEGLNPPWGVPGCDCICAVREAFADLQVGAVVPWTRPYCMHK